MKTRTLGLTVVVLLLAVSAACGEGDGERSTGDVPSEIIVAINAYIAAGNAESGDSPITRDRELELPEDCTPGDLCLFPANTVVSEDEAAIGVATDTSDASWQFTLERDGGEWEVIDVEYTGG